MKLNKRAVLFLVVIALLFAYNSLKANTAQQGQTYLPEITGSVSVEPGSATEALPDPVPETAPNAPDQGLQLLPDEPAPAQEETVPELPAAEPEKTLPEDGVYDSKEEVALYIHLYGHLPSNYITKKQAEKLGWNGGKLDNYAPGKCIGGTYFGNYEGILPTAKGRQYTECDIDTMGARSRGAKRIVFSNDGLIYYTDDHYESFELLYGEP